MAYGLSADAMNEYLRISATTTSKCLDYFVDGIVYLFQDEYLRTPTEEDLQRYYKVEKSGIDCMHWEWKTCPRAWHGQYSRGHEKPTIVLEAVPSQDLWIWHAFFGAPCTCNDLNVLDRSPVSDDILEGRAPKVNYEVNVRHMGYYLTNGIYPKWATFIQSISLPQGLKASLFAKKQEGARKDVERAFGVLQARFAIVRNPTLSWDKEKIGKIMKACIILHNMIVKDEQDQRTQINVSKFTQGEDKMPSQVDYAFSSATPTNVNNMMANQTLLHDKKCFNN